MAFLLGLSALLDYDARQRCVQGAGAQRVTLGRQGTVTSSDDTEERIRPKHRVVEEGEITLTPLPDLQDLVAHDSDEVTGTSSGELPAVMETPTLGVPPSSRFRHSTDEIDTGVWDGMHRSQVMAEDGLRVIADRYEVLERVGSGGMARIYKVKHISLGKIFAIKVMDRQSDAAKRIEQLFFREARVASEMNHPNLVQVIDFGLDDTLGAYIVMEYLTGETLHARLNKLARAKQRMHEAAVLEIGLQIAEALHYMHGQNIIHCDIKSENIFLCQHQKEHRQRTFVKLIDFGLSRRKSSGLKLAQVEVAGTPEYMAPELLRGSSPQPGMDVYSLGVLFYEMLSGRLPFKGTIEQVIKSQLFDPPEDLASVLPEGADERLLAFVSKALAKEPRLRHGSMGPVIFELRTLMEMRNLREGHKGRTLVGRIAPSSSKGDSQRAEHKRFFSHCPCPLFQLDPEGHLIQSNKAFRHFVGLGQDAVSGLRVDETRLIYVYPSMLEDIRALVKRGSRSPIQRSLSFRLPEGKIVLMMCWLTPDRDDEGTITRIDGVIHPLHE